MDDHKFLGYQHFVAGAVDSDVDVVVVLINGILKMTTYILVWLQATPCGYILFCQFRLIVVFVMVGFFVGETVRVLGIILLLKVWGLWP